MPADVVIRRATSSDVPKIEACVHAAYRHYIDRIGKSPGPMLDDYAEVVQTSDAYVAEEQGTIVGVLVLVRSETGLLLDNVAVQPPSQRRGIGRRLIGFAEGRARELGYERLDLYTHALMTGNISLYRSMGYEETDRRTVRGYDRVYMRKALI